MIDTSSGAAFQPRNDTAPPPRIPQNSFLKEMSARLNYSIEGATNCPVCWTPPSNLNAQALRAWVERNTVGVVKGARLTANGMALDVAAIDPEDEAALKSASLDPQYEGDQMVRVYAAGRGSARLSDDHIDPRDVYDGRYDTTSTRGVSGADWSQLLDALRAKGFMLPGSISPTSDLKLFLVALTAAVQAYDPLATGLKLQAQTFTPAPTPTIGLSADQRRRLSPDEERRLADQRQLAEERRANHVVSQIDRMMGR